jgi:hypothetical protein
VRTRDPYVRVAAEAPFEPPLVLGLDLVVELFGDPLADLGQHRARVEPGRELLDDRADQADVPQAALDGLRGAGVLELDCDILAIARARPVHLAERGERERLFVDIGEEVTDPGIAVLLDHASQAAEGNGARRLILCARVELDHREELPNLRAGALQMPELSAEFRRQRTRACGLAPA